MRKLIISQLNQQDLDILNFKKAAFSLCVVALFAMPQFLAAQCEHDHGSEFRFHESKQKDVKPSAESRRQDAWFTEVSKSIGINFDGISYSSSWGDIDGDGYPDLFAGNHGTPTVYYNNGGTSFTEYYLPFALDTAYMLGFDTLTQAELDTISPSRVDTSILRYDLHASNFVDFDNDGDQDLFSNLGAQGGFTAKSNILFLNDGNDLVIDNKAIDYGLDYEFGRGRGQLWFDQDNDGNLDLFLCNVKRTDGKGPTTLLRQENGTYVDRINEIGLTETNLGIAQLGTAGDSKDLRLIGISSNTLYNYDFSSLPFQNKDELTAPSFNDIAVNDYNGDLIPDIYITTGGEATEARISDDTLLVFMAKTGSGDEFSQVKFETEGNLSFLVGYTPAVPGGTQNRIYIGKNKKNPDGPLFELDPNDPDNQGNANINIFTGEGIYISYIPGTELWHIRVLDFGIANVPIVVSSKNPITNLKRLDFNEGDNDKIELIYFQNADGSYTKSNTFAGGAQLKTSSTSVAAADFDNDMDVDIFLSNTLTTMNGENMLLENDGSGNFSVISGFGGEGVSYGRGGTAIAADYDNNGTIDVLTENGHGLFFNQGTLELFRNNRTENNWIQVDLDGVASNKDAIGALVYCYAGGVGQVRLNQNGIHKFGQDHKRVHFGLAQNEIVDSLVIHWPSGSVSRSESLNANQIISVTEGQVITSVLQNFDKSIKISPVPFKDEISISPINGFSDNNVRIRLVDLAGRTVFEINKDSFNGQFKIDNLKGASGVYVLDYAGDNLKFTKKIIKF